jgi:hypothetical protein
MQARQTRVEYSVTVPGGKALKSSSRVFFAADMSFPTNQSLRLERPTISSPDRHECLTKNIVAMAQRQIEFRFHITRGRFEFSEFKKLSIEQM